MRGAEPESEPIKLTEDMVLKTFFKVPAETQSELNERAKRHHCSHTTETGYDALARMKEKMDFEAAMRGSLIDEKTRQMREREMNVGASSSIPVTDNMSTNDYGKIDVDTIDGEPSTYVVSSRKPDPPTC
ncbi:hypothetical protein EJD97_010301 [Solanum chilense]|uniref:Uncharacterized protein n=1 Tax=Solanum chilense TaxID=4083 RepID=A0A6N2BHX8_SOLCI|nr:hypothetical protein EJD97_010301 [Solanum chilense]